MESEEEISDFTSKEGILKDFLEELEPGDI